MSNFVATELFTHGTPPFNIPNIHFVHVALASIDDAGITRTYLVEEFIDESVEGKFTKYISNNSPSPLSNLDAKSSRIARYLSFAQHVQYIKMRKLAYVADFHGLHSILYVLLTIFTSDLSGCLFTEGNLMHVFTSFEDKHVCNEFCKFFST
ncbi:uncharacterized protein EDB93DRAFT_1083164 [Suillus bovinus]|uniref:uncharacterized protein n=1 Tax=Suillus bovinus TaxID=48563 RepID=UPI001B85E019|nr:uncharacterized protein EDB93DRAFT_1083164 [Suillus bovinus]KAG2151648.1 hypothetical protein EDB93DRAFT_1083164 [Suillus bovinus]